ncbi:MAG: cysteine protease StiP family protein [Chitinispirillaceae bacterium]
MNTTIGSYPPGDVTFLLKEISDQVREVNTEEREQLIQSGVHYSEMLPREYEPTAQYIALFKNLLESHASKIALITAVTARRIKRYFRSRPVLVSLARAGTPAGVLLRRYIRSSYEEDWPHYSISIIRGKGIDTNALNYLVDAYGEDPLVFIDGWTGKGAITRELQQACEEYNNQYSKKVKPVLAVLADPGYCANICATFEDLLIPNACLNATVSGLVSRTFHRSDIIGPDDYHGVKFYSDKLSEDYSNLFVNRIEREFPALRETEDADCDFFVSNPTFSGMKSVEEIQKRYSIDSIHRIKPGVGETTRVLLRRMPWKVLVNPQSSNNIDHILQLAKERNVPVEQYTHMPYSCCGLIRKKRDK